MDYTQYLASIGHEDYSSDGDFSVVRKPRKAQQAVRKCINCNEILENEGHHLYYQKFCSQSCKDAYISAVQSR